ncbi:MAG: SPOR domain-containing protein [Candidatus Rokuibacteriota bacterium]
MSGPDDQDLFEDAGPRSIFAATWFRVVLVVIVFAVMGAVAVPYILDYMNPPPTKPAVASRPPTPVARPNAAAPPAPAPAPQPSVPTAMPAQRAPQAAVPAQPPSAAASPAQPAPQALTPAQKPAAAAVSPPVVAQAQPKASPATPAAKPVPSEAKVAAQAAPKGEEKRGEEKPATTATATKPAAAKAPVSKRAVAKAAPVASSGAYWVQVGAFRDEDTAKRVAARVGAQNVVVMSTRTGEAAPAAPAPAAAAPSDPREPAGSADLYDVFVSGGVPADITRRLAGKGLASEPTAGGVVIQPSQPLRDAVALSKDLAVDGFRVQVRRAGGAAPRPAPVVRAAPPVPAPASGETLYRVRVGPYADRAAATVALRDLDAKGYKGFIARGEQ